MRRWHLYLLAVPIVFSIGMAVFSARENYRFKAACEAQGGVMLKGRGSRGCSIAVNGVMT
jgi:hypothetical protein